MSMLPRLTARDLVDLARRADRATACPRCAPLVCPGWESLPSGLDPSALRRVGTLRQEDEDEPTVAEYHPAGTNAWSADAPIAPAWYPYNRCDVWQCTGCGRAFLRYTEAGGYYTDERVREVVAERVHEGAAP